MSEPIWVEGNWRSADSRSTFQAIDPATRIPLDATYPVSSWTDLDRALDAAADAYETLRDGDPEQRARFLETFAGEIEADAAALVDIAHRETGLARAPRLAEVELPRTTQQLRQAAAAVREEAWAMATIDTAANLRSCFQSIGTVAVFGPNNFPFAFNAMSGGDFAAAFAVGNPVLAKAHPNHPGTSLRLAQAAARAADVVGLPAGAIQFLYHFDAEDGRRLAIDGRLAALAFTGSRRGGLALKAACDEAGKPAYLELSSINPVIILPGALEERCDEIAAEFTSSCLLGSGQFCTNPGLVLLLAGDVSESFISKVQEGFVATEPGLLLGEGVLQNLDSKVKTLSRAGAQVVCGGHPLEGPAIRYANTLLRITGRDFMENPVTLQTEAFGNATLFVVCAGPGKLMEVLEVLEGNLTGSIYSSRDGSDDDVYAHVAAELGRRVGRLLDDRMPTGVAVSAAMHHGGPYPSTGHAGFSAVGLPGSLRRFARLQCYDHVRPHRLPRVLRDPNPTGATWRWIDGRWTTEGVT